MFNGRTAYFNKHLKVYSKEIRKENRKRKNKMFMLFYSLNAQYMHFKILSIKMPNNHLLIFKYVSNDKFWNVPSYYVDFLTKLKFHILSNARKTRLVYLKYNVGFVVSSLEWTVILMPLKLRHFSWTPNIFLMSI